VTPQSLTGVILAGGESKRMGFDKFLLRLGGVSLLRSQIRQLKTVCNEIFVVSSREIPSNLTRGATVIPDIIPGKGPLSGLHAALSQNGVERVWLVSCDMPTISIPFIEHTLTIHNKNREIPVIATQNSEGFIEPFNALYTTAFLPFITQHITTEKSALHRVIRSAPSLLLSPEDIHPFSPDWSLFASLNTQKDVEKFTQYSQG
jgi:molybdopterin-guanine dinucleotide biosynthesis protein A